MRHPGSSVNAWDRMSYVHKSMEDALKYQKQLGRDHARKPTQPQDGQGLLEVVMAIGIIIIGLVGTLTLIIWTIAIGSVSQSQIIALNLAREGVEVSRSIRDGNWLKMDSGYPAGVQWDDGLYQAGNSYQAIVHYDSGTGKWMLQFSNDLANVIPGFTNDSTLIKQDSSTKFMNQNVPAGDVTQYKRLITTYAICGTASSHHTVGEGAGCSGGEEKIGHEVTSEVRWNERGRTHSAKIVDQLFNWKT